MEPLITVLLIDDEKHIHRIVKYNLELEGFTVNTAESGKVGLEMLRSMKEKPDVILLDKMMPKMDGLEVLQAIREDSKLENIPVIMFTAKREVGDMKDAFEAWANGYITKPFDPETLGDRIKKKLMRIGFCSRAVKL